VSVGLLGLAALAALAAAILLVRTIASRTTA
jgi:hypothetical protein